VERKRWGWLYPPKLRRKKACPKNKELL
jgi:hypothetical protein